MIFTNLKRRGFTLVELLVVIGIIAVLISMLLPSLNKARQSATRIACAANLKQCGFAFQMYLNDNNGVYPFAIASADPTANFYTTSNTMWFTSLRKYLGNKTDPTIGGTPGADMAVLQCPADTNVARVPWLSGGVRSYEMPTTVGIDPVYLSRRPGYPTSLFPWTYVNCGIGQIWNLGIDPNPLVIRSNMVKPVTKVILLTEKALVDTAQDTTYAGGESHYLYFPWYQIQSGPLHGTRYNYLFCDGHVEALLPKETINPSYPNELVPYNFGAGKNYCPDWYIRPDDM